MTKSVVAVILSGCGVFDGSEIYEVAFTSLALAKSNIEFKFFAPKITQHETINHLTNTKERIDRNVLVESARIARGKILDIEELNYEEYKGVVIPGGFGVAKNLSNLALKQPTEETVVITKLTNSIKLFHQNKKPIFAICISTAIVSSILNNLNIKMTLGLSDFKNSISGSGNIHMSCEANSFILDQKNLIITTPAFMASDNLSEIFTGVETSVNALNKLIHL